MKIICPICQSPRVNKKSYLSGYNLQYCQNCTFEFIQNSKPTKTTPHIYNEGYFNGELTGAKGYDDYSLLRSQLIKEALKKITYINKFTTKKKLLDIGAGTGIFLQEAKKGGYQVAGNDISSYAIKHLKQNKIKTFSGSIEKKILAKEQFEIVTAWDVIEHLYNPVKAVQNIHSLLKPQGFLFLTTPDTKSLDAQILGDNWYGYKKIPEHVSFFNKKSLKKLLEESGFQLVELKPWGFYRNLSFIAKKLESYSSIFVLASMVLKILKLSDISFFIPLTDSFVVAKKSA